MRKIALSEVELAVNDEGPGSPVVFVHGFPLDHSLWDEQVAALSANYRCIAPDLRGFGQSQVVPGTATMDQMADDLAELLDKLGVSEPVALCGLSMGGYVAWQFWLRHRTRLRRLILCDTRAAADAPEAAQARYEMAAKVLLEGSGAIWETMKPRLFAPGTLQHHPELVARFEHVVRNNPPVGIAAALRGMAVRPDLTDRLAEIDVPTLLIVGEHDAISTPREMATIAQRIRGSQLVQIEAAGHLAPAENSAAVNKALAEFLG
jgi:pimeloyl-ACP methyl ester carboxylesterase